MKVPLSWLKDFLPITHTPHEIAKMLTMAGLEIEDIETPDLGFENVVVATVQSVEPHPDADKLCVAQVFDGNETLQVVCGAPNCAAGLKTALARVGAKLPSGEGKPFKVKKSKIRGVESFGMLCSGAELGISEDHEGIVHFDERFQEGQDIAGLYNDTVFDVTLTPNLFHCASMLGVARELAAATGEKVQIPSIAVKEELNEAVESLAKVSVEDTQRCPRYACRVVKDVKVGPSPDWMQQRLKAAGVRPINNIVDITNYVLFELGHPLHAFDYRLLDGGTIVVRDAEEGEAFTTLDEKKRILSKEDLMICDGKGPVAIAGVMGGQNSEVSENTVDVLIESAYFDPRAIRRTSKRFGLSTESSKRFERGTDPNNVLRALDRAAMLMEEIAGGKTARGRIDVCPVAFTPKTIHCRLDRINSILGTQLGMGEVEGIFSRLELQVQWDGKNTFHITVPTYRNDLHHEIDLIEEVARLYGYDNVISGPARYEASRHPHSPIYLFERRVRSQLISQGLKELLTCDLISPSLSAHFKGKMMAADREIAVLNPTSIEQSILRTSLLPGMLQAVRHNLAHQNPTLHGFEVGRIHFRDQETFKEPSMAGIILVGQRMPSGWQGKADEVDFFDLKGHIETLLEVFHVEGVEWKNNGFQVFHPGRQASFYVGEMEIGTIGEIHPTILRELDIPTRVYFAEMNLHDLMKCCPSEEKMQALPIYPASDRDWTITLPKSIPIGEIIRKLRSTPSKLLKEVTLIDIYTSDKLGKDLHNVTFHFVYRDNRKTVAQESVDAEHARITEAAAAYSEEVSDEQTNNHGAGGARPSPDGMCKQS